MALSLVFVCHSPVSSGYLGFTREDNRGDQAGLFYGGSATHYMYLRHSYLGLESAARGAPMPEPGKRGGSALRSDCFDGLAAISSILPRVKAMFRRAADGSVSLI